MNNHPDDEQKNAEHFIEFLFVLSVGNEEDFDWFHPGGVLEPEVAGRGPPRADTDQILSPSRPAFSSQSTRLMIIYPKSRVKPFTTGRPPTHRAVHDHLYFGVSFSLPSGAPPHLFWMFWTTFFKVLLSHHDHYQTSFQVWNRRHVFIQNSFFQLIPITAVSVASRPNLWSIISVPHSAGRLLVWAVVDLFSHWYHHVSQ